jgi:hypothetical protein
VLFESVGATARAGGPSILVPKPLSYALVREDAFPALDRAVLMCDARIVARWRHAIVAHQPGVALRQILPCVGGQIAERCRQAVAAMLPRHAAKRPQRVLQARR